MFGGLSLVAHLQGIICIQFHIIRRSIGEATSIKVKFVLADLSFQFATILYQTCYFGLLASFRMLDIKYLLGDYPLNILVIREYLYLIVFAYLYLIVFANYISYCNAKSVVLVSSLYFCNLCFVFPLLVEETGLVIYYISVLFFTYIPTV